MRIEPEKQQVITYAFIDAANIIYRDTDRNPWSIDLKKLYKYLQERFGASRILFYSGQNRQSRIQENLYKKMRQWGYEMRLNPVKHFLNDRGETYTKADVDSRMTYEMMRYAPKYDRAVVMTGDGDFYWALEYLIQHKDRIWLLASPGKTAKELKQLFGSDFANLNSIRPTLEYYKNEVDSTNDSTSGITRPL